MYVSIVKMNCCSIALILMLRHLSWRTPRTSSKKAARSIKSVCCDYRFRSFTWCMYRVSSVQDTKKGTFVILQRNNKERSGMGNEKRSKVRRGAGELQHWLCVCICVCVLSYDSMILREVQGGCWWRECIYCIHVNPTSCIPHDSLVRPL
jgi:hypothetical protein